MSRVTRRPTRIAGGVSLVAGLGIVVSTIVEPVPATIVSVVGLALIATALSIGSRRVLDLGAFVGLVGVSIGALSAPVVWPLVGTVSVIVAWDLGGVAIRLGEQLGREAETARLELWYVLSSTAVGAGTAALAYGVYRYTEYGIGLDALVMILLAGVGAILALGARFEWNESAVRNRL
ncbi:DUF7519 family protein [Halovivax gelatinilyticus]|uniref:DUF7519 family protein n=1 Tax=Halovivax gelatinilyticus TaxID=2961597 RepID=UPI0020CA29C0|nr:hypothetical protein [Halovivax gelatinilyticus]